MCCPSYDYCGPLDPAESNSESCGLARQGSAFNGYYEGEVITSDEVEQESAPAAPQHPAPHPAANKQTMREVKSSTLTQARPIPVPQRDRSGEAPVPQTVQKSSSRRSS